jgi:SH3 domain protein
MRFLSRSLFCTLLFSGITLAANATPGWIGDQVLVPMRSGPGGTYRIVRDALKSGTPVEVIQPGDGWTEIQYDGITGYIPNQYLSNQPTAAIQLTGLQQRYKTLLADYQKNKSQLGESQKTQTSLQQTVNDLQQQLASAKNDLDRIKAVAADPLKVDEANKKLNEQLSLLQTQIDQVKADNSLLQHDHTYKGWALGLGTVILGMIFGAWIKSRSQRTRSGWA